MDTNYFFENFAKDYTYDVIFIDALHEEDQCYKDIKNSLNHLNEEGFIIVHDVSPIQEENTIPYLDFIDGRYYGSQWNGTVYKAFIKIKNELKNWSCFSIEEETGGCGILTQRKVLPNINIEFYDIWEFFIKNKKQLLQLITFDEFKNLIK